MTRAQVLAAMIDPSNEFELVDQFATFKLLDDAGFTQKVRDELVAEAITILAHRDNEQSLLIARARLNDPAWPRCMLPQLFRRHPELEEECTPQQAADLAAARREDAERMRQVAIANKQPLKFPEPPERTQ